MQPARFKGPRSALRPKRMSDWLISLEGTEAGHQLAVALALMAAFLHAFFGALQKGSHDPWLSRGVIDFCYGVIALPFVLFVVPPERQAGVKERLSELVHVSFDFENEGSRIVVYDADGYSGA